jgi:hypothetical protein
MVNLSGVAYFLTPLNDFMLLFFKASDSVETCSDSVETCGDSVETRSDSVETP